MGSEQGKGHGAPRTALSQRTPNGYCPMEGGPLWPPSAQIGGGGGQGWRQNETGRQAWWG